MNTQNIYLKFDVDKLRISRINKDLLITSGTRNYIQASFEFSSDWDNIDTTAVFVRKDIEPVTVKIEDGVCMVPELMTARMGRFTVSVYGGDLKTTNNAEIFVSGGGIVTVNPPNPPEPLHDYIQTPKGDMAVRQIRNNDGILQFFDGSEWHDNVFGEGDGLPGKNGVSPEITVISNAESEYKLKIVTATDETVTPNLKGKDGYTPRKGVDYFTETDIAEITMAVITSILDRLKD